MSQIVLLEQLKNYYNIIYLEDNTILLKPHITININNIECIEKYNFSSSKILECKINNIKFDTSKYRTLLNHLYINIIKKGSAIIRSSILNIETIEKNINGYNYIPELGISVQGVDSNRCIKEILNQCRMNHINIYMRIELHDMIIITIE